MKKLSAISVAFILVVFLLGCGSGLDILKQLIRGDTQATETPTLSHTETPTSNPTLLPTITHTENPTLEPTITSEPDYDFRNTFWGMTQYEVEQAEGGTVIEKSDDWLIFYDADVGGMSATIAYGFDNGELSNGMYMFEAEHNNGNAYIDDFTDLKDQLIDLYGQPIVYELLWTDDLFKNDPQNYGVAVSYGHLSYLATWETESTQLTLHLHGDNHDTSLTLIYGQVGGGGLTNDNGL
jgi:hypothetical protein